jgi:hypothetical protein
VTNPNKAKGTRWETAIVKALSAFWRGRHGLKPYRPAQSGPKDTGDIHGLSPFVIQAKDDRAFRISEWLDAAVKQAHHAGEPFGVVVVKRPRRPVGEAYSIVRLSDLASLILRLRRAEFLLEAHAPEAFLTHATQTCEDISSEFE